jgi:hypothetical protein
MTRFLSSASLATLAIAIAIATLSACATTTSLVEGQQATIEGEVISVDTDPWAYDGNAVITVSTRDAGTMQVQLPARWNLCKAEPFGDVQALKPKDRVHAAGTVTSAGTLVVCEQPEHHLRKAE